MSNETDKLKNKKYFCYEIYKNISIWSDQNKVNYNPCCIYDGTYATTQDVDIKSVWNNSGHKRLKQMIETDTIIPGCRVCYREEEAGRKSRRESVKQNYEDFLKDTNINLSLPQGMDYSVGNLCNMKCMICGPNSSTLWINDYKAMFPKKSVDGFKYNKNIQKLLDDADTLSNIRSIHFHGGGEPLLSDNHYELLNKIKQVKGLGDVKVFYNVNGTVIPNQRVLDIWSECLLVELYISLDDVGERFDYHRTGATWKQVTDNIKTLKKIMPHNHMFKINCVWSFLNLYYLDELYDWHKQNFSTNRYGDPVNFILQKAQGYFEINSLPTPTKDILKHKFANYEELYNIVNNMPDGTDNTRFWNYVDQIDSVRNNDFRKICPEWSKLI
jgi:hypothetical protein